MKIGSLVVGPALAVALAGCAHTKTSVRNPAALTHPAVTAQTVASHVGVRTAGSTVEPRPSPLYFNFDSALLSDHAETDLQRAAALLQRHPHEALRIEGNCDERGTEAYNLALGEHRALAAKRYLERLGVAAGRLKTLSYGKERPAVVGHDEAAWAKNRRDDLVVEAGR